jgi:hypothetical protein
MLKNILITSTALISLLAVSACSTTGTTNAGAFAVVQSESNAITTAINTLAPNLINTLAASQQADASSAVKALSALNNAIQSGSANASTIEDIEQFNTLVGTVTSELPLPVNTEVFIQGGIVLVNAVLANIPVAPASSTGSATPATATAPRMAAPAPIVTVGGKSVVTGPISIPLS